MILRIFSLVAPSRVRELKPICQLLNSERNVAPSRVRELKLLLRVFPYLLTCRTLTGA